MKLYRGNFFDSVFLTIALLLFQIYLGIIPGWKKITSDFPNYYVSAKLLSEQKDLSVLYDNVSFNKQIKNYGIDAPGQFALYSPPNALVFIPFINFSPLAAKRIWLVINILLIILCGFLIKEITNWQLIRSFNLLFLSGFALANDLFLGQIYLFLTTLLLCGYLLFQKNKWTVSGLSWGIIMALKYLPFVFLPLLIIKRKWNTLISMTAVFILLNLICLPFFGVVVFKEFIQNHFFGHLSGKVYEGNPFSVQYQSWDSLLNNLFVHDAQFNPHPVFNFPAGFIFTKIIIWTMVLSILILFYLKSYRQKCFFEMVSSLSIISLLILEPASATYHNLFLVLPFVIILKLLIDASQKFHQFYFSALFFLIGFLPTLLNKFYLFNDGNIFLSYNRLWLEMIFYFYSAGLLFWINGRRRNEARSLLPDKNFQQSVTGICKSPYFFIYFVLSKSF